jgi:hypothetical protein
LTAALQSSVNDLGVNTNNCHCTRSLPYAFSGFDANAYPDDYINQRPDDFERVKMNRFIIQAILDKHKDPHRVCYECIQIQVARELHTSANQ